MAIGKLAIKASIMIMLFLSGCSHHKNHKSVVMVPLPPQVNVKVQWKRQEFLYVDSTYNFTDEIISYKINADGTLNPPFTYNYADNLAAVPSQFETSITGLTVDPSHDLVYYIIFDNAAGIDRAGRYLVSQYGLLDLKQSFASGNVNSLPVSIAIAGHGRFVYVMYEQIALSRYLLLAYHLSNQGKLERLHGSPVVVASTADIATADPIFDDVAYAVISPSSHFLYIVRPIGQGLDAYRISISGKISIRPICTLSLGYRAGSAAICPNGRFLYIADVDNGSLVAYRIGDDGKPAPLPVAAAGRYPIINPAGRFLYASASGGRILLCYRISVNGTLHLLGSVATQVISYALCVDTTGRFFYTLGNSPTRRGEWVISQFRIMRNGMLTPLQPEQVPAVYSTHLVTAQEINSIP